MSMGECHYIEKHVAAQWDDGSYRLFVFQFLCVDSGIVQQMRHRTNPDGTLEYEYYIHYIDRIYSCSSEIVNNI